MSNSVEKVEHTEITPALAAQMLGHSSTGRVLTLVREGRLPTPLTYGAVVEYRDNRGKKGGSKGDSKLYHIRLTPDEFAELSARFGEDLVDPYEATKRRQEAEMADAAKELAKIEAMLA